MTDYRAEVEGWLCSDGDVFPTREQAVAHAALVAVGGPEYVRQLPDGPWERLNAPTDYRASWEQVAREDLRWKALYEHLVDEVEEFLMADPRRRGFAAAHRRLERVVRDPGRLDRERHRVKGDRDG